MNKVARIGPEQYTSMAALRDALMKTGFPPPRLEYLLTQQGIELNSMAVFSVRSGRDYLYCNANDDQEAQLLFQEHFSIRR